MRATLYFGPRDMRVENVPDPKVEHQHDAVIRITHACICGSDLWFYRGIIPYEVQQGVGHEMLGVVEHLGSDVRTVKVGDTVLVPISFADGTCEYCKKGLQTSCANGGFMGYGGNSGGQAEGARVPYADASLVRVPEEITDDEEMLLRVLPLTDVMSTGHHAAIAAGVIAGSTVAVVGDGAVGLCGVLAAARLGAQRIIAVGHHVGRLEIARRFGATDIVVSDGSSATERIREMTAGGPECVLECVGNQGAMDIAVAIVRAGGVVGYVGVPNEVHGIDLGKLFQHNISIRGGVTPARAYIPELLDDVIAGTLDPSPVLDATVSLDDVAKGYAAMDSREALKVVVKP